MEQSLSLMTFYQGWEAYQQALVESIAPLSPTQLAMPVAPHHWTIGLVAQHLIASRVWWFQLWVGEGSPELALILHWDPVDYEQPPTLEAAELVAGLESTWTMIVQALTRWTPADLATTFSPPASLSEEAQSRSGDLTLQYIIWHVFEHEIHHGGEMSVALGSLGLQGVYGDA